ncbi:uncharacterized protein LOC34618809 [Cyclospora cayetanensis]|uniref:Uncharacterized protein LOC34618809 n=1 Tax=Cyclospora cayetanensis TaxID=88456 RepID=A0A6P6RX57_9EIME|nr:uncharacterized protein LOC34618809 [Cyclospora cayetanensis]
MEFVVGDQSGLCKELFCSTGGNRRTRIIKKAKQDRSLAVTALCWTGPSGGSEVSEVALGRACGTVEAFATSSVVCESPLAVSASPGESPLDVPLRCFQLPSTPVSLSVIGSEAARAYTRSLICKSWLGSGITPGEAALRDELLPSDIDSGEADSSGSSSRSLLLAVGQKGHTCVVDWEGSFSARIIEQTSVTAGLLPDSRFGEGLTHVAVHFRPVEKEHSSDDSVLQRTPFESSFCCRAAYLLPGPVAAASSHPLCHSLLAFGGKENDAKVLDLDYGKILWTAKNVKHSFLGLRSDVAVTQIDWLLPVHPMVLAVGTAKGAMRFYDLRCQRRPVLEVCGATQENRPVTALCIRPTAEILRQKTDIRLALRSASETLASSSGFGQSKGALHAQDCAAGRNVLADSPIRHVFGDNANTKAAQDLLACCSGKDTATVYYADSYGMVYGLRVMGGTALLRLADKTCPKYNPSSYRSSGNVQLADQPDEIKRKLIVSMLEKQRERLTSKKNDHPISIASCIDLQLAAVPIGGFKGVMGAVVGLALDPAGERLLAVGMGRHAYIFDAKSRKLCFQVFLKQKLTCVLSGGGDAAGGVKHCTPSRAEVSSKAGGKTDSSSAESESDSDSGDSAIPGSDAEKRRRRILKELHAVPHDKVQEQGYNEHTDMGPSSRKRKHRPVEEPGNRRPKPHTK